VARQPGRRARSATDPAAPDSEPRDPQSGTLLDGRYRLSRQLTKPGQRWSAVDQVLDRPVEIRFVDAPPETLAELVTTAADRYDGRWLRLLDAGGEGGRGWLVVEDPCRPSVADRVREAPLDPDTSVALVLSVARALLDTGPTAAVVTPDRVYLDEGGVRLDGQLEAALEPAPARAAPSEEAEAVRALGRLLLFALTGVGSGPTSPGVPPAVAGTSPRRLRGGVSRRVDAVTTRAINGTIRRLAELVAALEALPRPRRREEPRPAALVTRRVVGWVLPPLGLAAVGLVAWTLGSDLGAVPGADTANPPIRQPAAARHASALVWHHPPRVRSFDPAGDGQEDPAGARYAVDGRPATFWTTDHYRTATFGGLKPGVGLVVDLAHPRPVGGMTLLLTTAGAGVQVRAGNRFPTGIHSLPPLVPGGRVVAHTAEVHRTFPRPVRARYWLFWLTRLPRRQGGFAEGIREIRLERPGVR